MMSTTDARADEAAAAGAAQLSSGGRLVALDQFRGYTVAGMWVVNFLGGFSVTPALLRHHNTYCSYADTIMPQFLFAVGFAFRLTFGRRAATQGLAAAYRRVARRLAGLVLLSLVLYTLGVESVEWARLTESGAATTIATLAKRHWFQTLLHIAATSLWILPVIRAGASVRVAYLVFSAGLHVALSAWFGFAWVNSPPRGVDGGPLGFLSWSIPALVGTLACDALAAGAHARLARPAAWALALMALGYGLSCGSRFYDLEPGQPPGAGELAASPVLLPLDRSRPTDLGSFLVEPPFVAPPAPSQRPWNYWMMSQRSGSVSYQVFATGLALAVFVLFVLACERLGWHSGLFRTLGSNALMAYVLGGMMERAIQPLLSRNAPGWQVLIGLAVFFGSCCLLVRLLEKKGLLLRL